MGDLWHLMLNYKIARRVELAPTLLKMMQTINANYSERMAA